jgi:sugar phosphate isomerase/epimerase
MRDQPSLALPRKRQDPNEVATPESMEKLLAMSKAFVINFDIGLHGGSNDARVLKKHHDRITHLHVKDRKKDRAPTCSWGRRHADRRVPAGYS